ncbi:MAG: Nramp family divalent metal transporter [Anaerolineales bacterium]|nr:Nramp family divalent metal transporter [Anaerolineales bacterium]
MDDDKLRVQDDLPVTEAAATQKIATAPDGVLQRQIGMSRPALIVDDLPTPEQVFRVRRIGVEQMIALVLGPSLVALGISVGSGEWLIGPLNVAKYGFMGIGWVILVSAVLQVFYNVELARFTLATGETPVVAFGRIPPGYFVWVPLALLSFYIAFILGGWAVQAGAGLFALVSNRPYGENELEVVRIIGIGLLLTTFLFTAFGRKIERTLEGVMGAVLAFMLIGMLSITIVVVPANYWGTALASLVTPVLPPAGSDPSLLGALAGFTALASGLNFMFIGYYRDKGYGMGSKVGFLPAWFGSRSAQAKGTLQSVGRIFPEDEKNARTWKRWFRYLAFDQWVIYFIGALVGMLVPSILVGYISTIPGSDVPTSATMVTYAASELGRRYGPVVNGWMLLIGFMVLFTTQIVVLELLVRNMTDGLYSLSGRFRQWIGNDPRKFYYPFMLVMIVVISVFIHLALPEDLILISGNVSNFAAIIFPLGLIYLNSQLPRPAKIRWWSYVVLVLNTLFFGFFFVNFLAVQLSGAPLVRF